MSTRPQACDINVALPAITPKVSDAMNEVMVQPYTANEVTNVLSQMYPYKSPGLNVIVHTFF